MKHLWKKLIGIVSVSATLFAVGCNHLTEPTVESVSIEQELNAMVNSSSSTISDDGIACKDFDPMNGEYYRFDGAMEIRKGRGRNHDKGGRHGGKRDSLHIGKGHKGRADSLSMIIKCLNLDANQIASVKIITDSLRSQVRSIIKATREEQKSLRETAKAEAKVVFDQLKAGTITKDEAIAQLDAIRTALVTALEPGRTKAQEQIKIVRDSAIAQIRELLTDEQKAILDNWIATSTIPCS
jgi:Spy/CpxP family protein refolding chaperone